MHRFAPVALATLIAATAPARLHAQAFTPPQPTGKFTDPANLAGERIRPRNGRELPIDGGLSANGQPDNALTLAQQLRRLNTRASLMLIVAHPDDEDGGMLTFYSRGLGARVAILTLNRGEGGQNQMTSDFDDALGLLRTQELLSADRYMGVDQMFGTEVDFGFSKTKAEAFQKWNHQRVLYDAVRAVRIYRPLVIASVFEGAVTDGHGQHQVSGQIAQEVFKAAGDPNIFPELTKEGILPWQPLKVYARVPFSRVSAQGLYDYATGQTVPAQFTNYVTGETFTTTPTADVTINEGQTDPLLSTCAASSADLPRSLLSSRSAAEGSASPSTDCQPLSYVQFARIGLGLQRSQIGGGMRVPPAGRSEVSYHRYGSKLKNQPAHEDSFFDGIDTSWTGIESLDPGDHYSADIMFSLERHIQYCVEHFDPAHPQAIAPQLADALDDLDRQIQNIDALPNLTTARANLLHELRIKRAQLEQALALALGVKFDATAPAADIDTGSVVKLSARIEETSELPLTIKDVYIQVGEDGRSKDVESKRADRPLTSDHADQRTLTIPASETQNATRPYFYRNSIEDAVYQLSVPALRNAPATPPAAVAWANLDYRGTRIPIGRVVHSADQPIRFVPPINLSLSAHAQVLPLSLRSLTLQAEVRAASEVTPKSTLLSSVPDGWTVRPTTSPLLPGLTALSVVAPPSAVQAITLRTVARTPDNDHYTEGFRPVGYGDLPRTNYYTPATVRIVPVDLKLPPENKRRIGYLPGTGDDVPAALASIGLAPTMLKVSDLTPELSQFDTVILGIRTYNAHPDLHGAPTQALLDFARNGGNVIVQYQTGEFTAADAPYPISVSRGERVIDETDPVVLLTTANSQLKTDSQTRSAEELLTTPNKITPADFNNWVEERGHGFPDSWDPHYTALTEVHDPGAPAEHIEPESPQRGGILTTRLGKGRWTYVAFALYRQLPEAVPGAFRLFVNLLNP